MASPAGCPKPPLPKPGCQHLLALPEPKVGAHLLEEHSKSTGRGQHPGLARSGPSEQDFFKDQERVMQPVPGGGGRPEGHTPIAASLHQPWGHRLREFTPTGSGPKPPRAWPQGPHTFLQAPQVPT